ncbi:Putative purine-cytosine permease [Septoria linicola]|uniref:Purine-cytosine permease n=1 Tax=Septoria linicola TaxID=215465 RepID=A0A9Q9EKV6_9PEZI|nr:putative purine-cytosine permease [Septoria linicola]USW53702.1 Putative purine-cytosine permease [Septoria linicola]
MPHFVSTIRNVLEVKRTREEEDAGATDYGKWSNIDLEPTPPEQRNWSPWFYFAFQFSIAFSPTTYNIGSSLFSIGLSWWIIIIAAFVGTFLCCLVLYFNARGPLFYHIGFPVYARVAAGIYGSLWFIFIRAVVAIFYMGTQTYYASRLMDVSLRCIFGHQWTDVPNTLPASAGITTSQMIAFFVTWTLQFPFAWLHPSKAGPLFVVKSVLSPVAYCATMIWALVKFEGVNLNLGKSGVTGSALGWSFMKAINTVVSGVVPPMVNIADLARYGNRPRDVVPLTIGLFISKPAVILLGMFTTAAGAKHFGVANWNLWDFYGLVLDEFWGPGARTLVFLGAFIQCFATVVTNVSSNAIPVGCDLTGLFPRYFTITRGMILCHLLVWPVVPWLLVNSAQNFLTFLGSYLCFITPVVAIMIVDYWISRKGNIHIPSVYRPEAGSPYHYTRGFNLRAYAAWAVGVALVISGISGAIQPGSIDQTAVNIYNCGFILSFSGAAVTYYLLCLIWPVQVFQSGRHEYDSKARETMVPTEGFFMDDSPLPDYIQEKMLVGEEPAATTIDVNDRLKDKEFLYSGRDQK